MSIRPLATRRRRWRRRRPARGVGELRGARAGRLEHEAGTDIEIHTRREIGQDAVERLQARILEAGGARIEEVPAGRRHTADAVDGRRVGQQVVLAQAVDDRRQGDVLRGRGVPVETPPRTARERGVAREHRVTGIERARVRRLGEGLGRQRGVPGAGRARGDDRLRGQGLHEHEVGHVEVRRAAGAGSGRVDLWHDEARARGRRHRHVEPLDTGRRGARRRVGDQILRRRRRRPSGSPPWSSSGWSPTRARSTATACRPGSAASGPRRPSSASRKRARSCPRPDH
jgi:hypothetical protein